MSKAKFGSAKNLVILIALTATPVVSVAAEQCLATFRLANPDRQRIVEPVKTKELIDGLAVKKVTPLDDVVQRLRNLILLSGEIDTTKLRSEFKHYIGATKTDQIISHLAVEFPPVYDVGGKLILGLTSRDNQVKVKEDLFVKAGMGSEIVGQIKSANLLPALQIPEVLAQHKNLIVAKLTNLFGQKKAVKIVEQAEQLQRKTAKEMAARGRRVYTDTSSTSKFAYRSGTSRDAILESASQYGIALKESEVSNLERIDFYRINERDKNSAINVFTRLGVEKDISQNFINDLIERSVDEGVIRYRKYRTGPENLDFRGIPAPASALKPTHSQIQDAPFADKVTWLEFKMKNSNGEVARRTVVNKPRLPLSDENISVLKDASRFISPEAYSETKEIIKGDIRTTVERLQSQGVKEAGWNEVEVDAALSFIRGLHLQGHSLEPVGRTVYMRDSYNLNLADRDGKSHNIQITRDRHVWELDRGEGQMLQGLSWIETSKNWHFQYNARSGLYEHRDSLSGKVLHVFHPRTPDVVYELQGTAHVPIKAELEPVEVVELKVPLQFIRLSPDDVSKLPQLASIVRARKEMVQETEALNMRRNQVGLSPFKVDKGKRSTSRGDVAGGVTLRVHPQSLPSSVVASQLVPREFRFNPETGYWVNWSEGADLVYHPSVGVLRLLGDRHVTTVPVYYRER